MAEPNYSSARPLAASRPVSSTLNTQVANGTTYATPPKPPRKNVSNAHSAQSPQLAQLTNLLRTMEDMRLVLTSLDQEVEDHEDHEEQPENDDDYEEAVEELQPQTSGLNVVESKGRKITIAAGVEANVPDYNVAENVRSKPSVGITGQVVCIDQKPKTYVNMEAYYGYLTSTKFLNKDQITDYLTWSGLVHSLNQPLHSDMMKYKQKIAIKAIKLANGILPIKPSNLTSFKDLPNRKTQEFCNTSYLEFDIDMSKIKTTVDYTTRDFSMSFYNALFMQLIKKSQTNQTTFIKMCDDLLIKVSEKDRFRPVIDFYENNVGFVAQTQLDVVEFFKMIIGRCADIVYETTKGPLDAKDKFTRIGKFPQNECMMALSSLGYEIYLHIDIEKMKCTRIYTPAKSARGEVLNFYINNNGVFSYL